MKIFLDTNVLASALATHGLCAELFEQILGHHQLISCREVLDELRRILAEKFRLPKPVVNGYIRLLKAEARIADAGGITVKFSQDPDDAPILACAVAAKADAFVTGDNKLLELDSIQGVPIISPRELWIKLN